MDDSKLVRFTKELIAEKGITKSSYLQKADNSLYETLRRRGLLGKLGFSKGRTWEDRVNEGEWSKEEKALFFKFAEKAQLKRRPVGPIRIEKYRTDLLIAQSMAGMDLMAMVRDMKGLEKAVKSINSDKDYSFVSKKDAKRTLGSLYHFKHEGDVSLQYAPRELKELIAHEAKSSDKRLAKEVITRPEMREMLGFGDTLDKAIISLLFDSGMRMGEFVQLRKSDITQIAEGLEVRVPGGKTGQRKVTVVEAKSYMNAWLEEHPVKGEDAPLWLPRDRVLFVPAGGTAKTPRRDRKPFTGAGITRRIKLVVEAMNAHRKRKGLPLYKKPFNPHNFRHSRATELGGVGTMNEALMCKHFGWEIGSSMPKTYLHLTDEQVRKAVLASYGKARKEEPKEIVTHRTCPFCKHENPLKVEGVELQTCILCTQPLDSDKQVTRMGELEERIKSLEAALDRRVVGEVVRKAIKKKKG